jgi:O-antigen/teichoic acid export membrane protein
MNPGDSRTGNVEARVRLMWDGVVNNSGLVVSGLVSLILVPILLRGLGAEAYGLWIAAMVLGGLMSVLDLGLGTSVIREVAATLSTETSAATARFVRATGNAYLASALAGALLVTLLGLPLSAGMHLSAQVRQTALTVFFFAGLTFAGDQLRTFTASILYGLRRFDAVNLLLILAVLLRASGVILLLKLGRGLVAVATWHAVTAATTALVGFAVVSRLSPHFRFRLGYLDWHSLRAHIPFGVASQVTMWLLNAVWSVPALLVGAVLGSPSLTQFHIGQKFPLAVSGFTWRVAEVVFPAASEHERANNLPGTREILEVGTRWVLVLALPICLVLSIVAADLLQAWVGEVRPNTVGVLRLTTAAVFINALGDSALNLLWGRGAMRTILVTVSSMAIVSIGLTLAFVFWIGIVGAAWVLLGMAAIGWITFLRAASRDCGVRAFDLMRASTQGLLVPMFACAVPALGITYLARPGGWLTVVGASVVGGCAYAAALYLWGGRQEERAIVRWPVRLTLGLLRSFYHAIRRTSASGP